MRFDKNWVIILDFCKFNPKFFLFLLLDAFSRSTPSRHCSRRFLLSFSCFLSLLLLLNRPYIDVALFFFFSFIFLLLLWFICVLIVSSSSSPPTFSPFFSIAPTSMPCFALLPHPYLYRFRFGYDIDRDGKFTAKLMAVNGDMNE